jgi:glyoxylase-like metal-dependent hydrolase (beta-lactamase superfamily II)
MATIGSEAITAIASQKGIIIVDAGTSYTLTRKYREAIEKELNRDDFVYVINTHAHWDHISGNAIFSEAKIIGHENCPIEKEGNKGDPEKKRSWVLKIMDEYQMALDTLENGSPDWQDAFCQKARFQAVYNDLSELPAERDWDITFKDEFSLDMGDVRLEMKYFGKAHSNSDIVIHIPELKILFTGDLFSKWGRPSIYEDNENDVVQWKATMEWVMTRKNEIETIIGGHGQILTIEDLEAFKTFVDKSYQDK